MQTLFKCIVILLCFIALQATAASRVVVIILDGLRPDYVTPDLMPNTYKLAQQGVWFENNHSVFPTVTRVNAASIATGSYPKTHGLMGNTIYFPQVDHDKGLSTGDAANLVKVETATQGHLLTTESMGEYLERHSKRLLVVSSGSSGSAFLLNHKGAGLGLVHTELVLPASREVRVLHDLGEAPEDATPNQLRNQRAVDAYFQYGLGKEPADVTFMWLSDPDHTAHSVGIGHPDANRALTLVDAQVGRILAEHKRLGLDKTINILIASDHGFSTHLGGADIRGPLKRDNLDKGVVVVGPAIYVTDKNREQIAAIVETFRKEAWVGSIFTAAKKNGSTEGRYPGTFSFDVIHYNHERSPDILLGPVWTNKKNQYGYAGTTTYPGVAGHGSPSPFDIHNTLIAVGPDFKSGLGSGVPSGNVDIAPTICRLLGIPVPTSMDGRVLEEAILGGPDPRSLRVEHNEYKVGDKRNPSRLRTSTILGHTYIDEAGKQ